MKIDARSALSRLSILAQSLYIPNYDPAVLEGGKVITAPIGQYVALDFLADKIYSGELQKLTPIGYFHFLNIGKYLSTDIEILIDENLVILTTYKHLFDFQYQRQGGFAIFKEEFEEKNLSFDSEIYMVTAIGDKMIKVSKPKGLKVGLTDRMKQLAPDFGVLQPVFVPKFVRI